LNTARLVQARVLEHREPCAGSGIAYANLCFWRCRNADQIKKYCETQNVAVPTQCLDAGKVANRKKSGAAYQVRMQHFALPFGMTGAF
jgi:hypothetical protein